MSRYRALLGCGLVIGTLGVVGCGSSSSSGSGSSSSDSAGSSASASTSAAASSGPATGSPYKIALLEPTTGALASIATQIADAGKYAVAAVNAKGGAGGHPLQLQILDTQLDPGTAASDYQQAATQDGALAVLGPLISPEVNAAIPVARRTQVPMLIPGAADIDFTHPVQPLIFRFGSEESQDDKAMANMTKHLGCTKVAFLYDNGALGLSSKQDIAQDISHFTVSVQISETATDLTPALDQIKAAGAQCIIEATDDLGGVGAMVRTMANIGYKVPVLGDSGVTLAPFAATAGTALKSVPVYGTNVFNPDSASFKSAFAGYSAKYGALPTVEEVGTTWDSVQALAAALKADGGKGGTTLASALQSVTGGQITSVIAANGATPSFSSSNHDWVPDSQDQMYRVLNGASGPKLQATGIGG